MRTRVELCTNLAVGDRALGFWAALDEVYSETRHQRCWMHKTANVLNYPPRGVQPEAKKALQGIWMAEDRTSAYKAFDHFV
ncbi:MAG TPA: transposase [Gammaproteobacteria bacterium]|nr:transposase [Gammaproteobacteria bacterium]